MKKSLVILSVLVKISFLQSVLPVYGHQQTAPWLDESSLDRGLYIEVRHSRVIRNPGPFDVSVVMSNLLGPGEVVVNQVRYVLPDSEVVVHPRSDVLSSRRSAYQEYKVVLRTLEQVTERGARASVETLSRQSYALLTDITRGTFRDRQSIPASLIPETIGSTFNLIVEVDVLQADELRTIQRLIEIPVQDALPTGPQGLWRAGDQHLHTAFSIDAFFVNGTRELVSDYAAVAQILGLDWSIITDHTNVHISVWYDPRLFIVGEVLAQTFRNNQNYLVLQGQEMGVGLSDPLGRPAHFLVYPRTSDFIGFVENPCTAIGFNCEPEQVIIDRVNAQGGIGFIAHPFVSQVVLAPWNRENNATGWAGLEIFSNPDGLLGLTDLRAIDWWYELLNEIPAPQNGQLQVRDDYPTRFPVGLGNSDAHEPTKIGATFAYANLGNALPGNAMVPRETLMDAFVNGRVVASNGPLVLGDINGAGIGEVAVVTPENNELMVTLQTTEEFGPVGEYTIVVNVDGSVRTIGAPIQVPGDPHMGTLVFGNLLRPPDKFVIIIAGRACAECPTDPVYLAVANPIWLEFE